MRKEEGRRKEETGGAAMKHPRGTPTLFQGAQDSPERARDVDNGRDVMGFLRCMWLG